MRDKRVDTYPSIPRDISYRSRSNLCEIPSTFARIIIVPHRTRESYVNRKLGFEPENRAHNVSDCEVNLRLDPDAKELARM